MLKNYLLAGFRNLKKHFTYSFINVLGLGLGIGTCMLLFIWIRSELSYDKFHAHASRIYRPSLEYSFGGQVIKTSLSPTALLPALMKNFPEVENGVRIDNPSSYRPFTVRKGEKIFLENKFYFVDSSFFQVFSFTLLQGHPDKVLTKPYSVVLTISTAKKYFGDEDPVGQIMEINAGTSYTVTGLMEDPPGNSLLQFKFLASFSSLGREARWWSADYQTYVLIDPQADVALLEEKTNQLVKKELAAELTSPGDYVLYPFMPLTDIYLKSHVDEPEETGSIQYIYVFSGIAVLILFVACVNYVNLATAKAADRAREVGMRKVVGAVRGQLFIQFLGESFLITLFGFCCALFICILMIPVLNSLAGKQFHAAVLLDTDFILLCLAGLVTVSLAAGTYPAYSIIAFKPVSVLKGNFKTSGEGVWLRKSLVVFQFTVSIILIVGTLVIIKQLDFMQAKKLGYEKENVIRIPLDGKGNSIYDQLKSELLRSGQVVATGRARSAPVKINSSYRISVEDSYHSETGMNTKAMPVDSDFIPAMGMKLVEGRNFTDNDFKRSVSETTNSFILNETALFQLGIEKLRAIGTRLTLNGRKGEIVGVMEDFHFNSLHEPIGPLVFFAGNENFNHLFIRLSPGSISEAVTAISPVLTTLLPHRPFEYEFLSDQYQNLYRQEQRMGLLSTVFTSLAIFIACLGLFGLVSFSAAQKTKEIGIRKVLGAKPLNILWLITSEFSALVVISVVVGLPVSYWIIEKLWLENFAYRTTIGAGLLITAALGCLVVAFTTAGYQALKAARIDPVKTLKSE